MRDKIRQILTQLSNAGYIQDVEFHKNHFYYRILDLDTTEQKKMVEEKIRAFIDKTEWEIIEKYKEYIIYDYSIIENILNEPNYENLTNEYSFMKVEGKIGDNNKITLISKKGCDRQFTDVGRYIYEHLKYKLSKKDENKFDSYIPLDNRISYIHPDYWVGNGRIKITTYRGDEFAEKKTWCKIENTKNELDAIFDI